MFVVLTKSCNSWIYSGLQILCTVVLSALIMGGFDVRASVVEVGCTILELGATVEVGRPVEEVEAVIRVGLL